MTEKIDSSTTKWQRLSHTMASATSNTGSSSDGSSQPSVFQELLSQDVLHSIFLFLEGQEVPRLALLCRNVCQSLRSSGLWAQLFQRDFRFIPEVAFLQPPILACTSTDPAIRERVLETNRGSYRRAFQLVTRPRVQRCVQLSADLSECQGPNERQGSSGCVLDIGMSCEMPTQQQSEVSSLEEQGKEGSRSAPDSADDALMTTTSSNRCCGCVAEPHLAVFGGWTVGFPSITNDMYVAVRDIEARANASPGGGAAPQNCRRAASAWKWHPVQMSGQRRMATYGHTLTSIGEGLCVLVGGVTVGGYRGETGSVDLVEVWREETHSPPPVVSDSPGSGGKKNSSTHQAAYSGHLRHFDTTNLTPRAYHSTTWVNHLKLGIVFGGFDHTGAIAALEGFQLRVRT